MGGGVRENPPHPLSPSPPKSSSRHRPGRGKPIYPGTRLGRRGRRGQEREALAYWRKPAQGRPRRRGYWILKAQLPTTAWAARPAADAYRRAVTWARSAACQLLHGPVLIELGSSGRPRAPSRRSSALTPVPPGAPCSPGPHPQAGGREGEGDQLSRAWSHLPGSTGRCTRIRGRARDGTEDPLLRRGLQEAVAELRRRSQEDGA